jgi:(2Fe-2S) ferredoxin
VPVRRLKILVCRGPECGDKRNSAAVHAEFQRVLAEPPPLAQGGVEVQLDWQSCFGKCQRGPNVLVREVRAGDDAFFQSFLVKDPGSALYNAVKPSEVPRIVAEHVRGGRVVVEFKGRG